MTPDRASEIEVVRAEKGHEPRIHRLLSEALGWQDDARHDALFRWKHEHNPFGASPAWVAVAGDELVGLRTFMSWEFQYGEANVRAVRAVDTATLPEYQGRGIFTRLTLAAVEALRAEGIDFVFNTPNDQSRPGYLKMGWKEVGRLTTVVRPTSLRALPRILRARRPAERWSHPSAAGVPAAEALSDRAVVDQLLSALGSSSRLRTRRSVEYLQWRYGWEELGYRAIAVSSDPTEGLALFRTRRRGPAVEASLCELLVPNGDLGIVRRLVRNVARAVEADHVIALSPPGLRGGLVPLPTVGPMLTWRALAMEEAPPRSAWALTLGDVELF